MYSSSSGAADAANSAKDNLISRYRIAGSRTVDYSYDGLNRLTQKKLSTTTPIYTNYTYKASDLGGKYTTTMVETEKLDNTTYKYYYDKVGNITSITKNSGDYRTYTYDNKNQLTREVNSTGSIISDYTYDSLGNITKKVEYTTSTKTINYRYGNDGKTGWNNLLTGVDLSGNGAYESTETISYDAIGNPTTYLGASLSWYGRQLKSYSVSGTTINYTYDADGLRGSKTVPGIIDCTYQYVGGQLRYETRGAHKFYYFYDASGNLSAIRYYNAGGTAYNYYALTNAQGDVVAFYNDAGTCVVTYDYDAWGNVVKTTDTTGINFAELNPIRYRGYYYDSETGLYYLQSRYYNPQVGRFLNADGYITTGQGVLSYNMFAYCLSNPILFADDSGARPIITASLKEETDKQRETSCKYMRNQQFVGSAAAYKYIPGSTNPNSPNCYAYAIGSTTNEQPGGASGVFPKQWNNVNDVGKSVEADLKVKGYTVRKISGPNSRVASNEFKIALRVGTKPYGYNPYTGEKFYDYHFMRQTNTGQWAEKHGIGGESVLWDAGMTPDTIPWTLGDKPYYDSDIIYYAVGK